jgi:hypothetical protein
MPSQHRKKENNNLTKQSTQLTNLLQHGVDLIAVHEQDLKHRIIHHSARTPQREKLFCSLTSSYNIMTELTCEGEKQTLRAFPSTLSFSRIGIRRRRRHITQPLTQLTRRPPFNHFFSLNHVVPSSRVSRVEDCDREMNELLGDLVFCNGLDVRCVAKFEQQRS